MERFRLTCGRALWALCGLAWAMAMPAQAQGEWPQRPITLVVPFGPGGIADITARTVALAMSTTLKVPIVVDNKPSAGSIVGSAAVAQATPDGYTLLLMSNANAVSASLFRKLPFDVQKDFAPVALLGVFDLALLVNEPARHKSVRELADDARAQPEVPTMGQAFVPDYDVASWNALAVPARTPPAVIDKLNAAANAALKSAAVQDRLLALGVRPVGGTPQEQQALLAREIQHWRAVIAAARIEPQ